MLSKKSQESAAVSSIPEYSVAGSTNLRSRFEWRSSVPEVLVRSHGGDDVARVFRQVYSSPHKSPAQADASATFVRYACVSAAGMGSRRQWHQRQEVNSRGWRFS